MLQDRVQEAAAYMSARRYGGLFVDLHVRFVHAVTVAVSRSIAGMKPRYGRHYFVLVKITLRSAW